jgi:hypothetical protein
LQEHLPADAPVAEAEPALATEEAKS